MIGVSTGGRISELLSLQIGDVWRNVHEMLKKAFIAAGLNGKLATHSLRKSFAQRVYEHSADIYLVQGLPGHKSVATTQKYIGINYATAREAVETMALGHEPYSTLLCHVPSRKTPMSSYTRICYTHRPSSLWTDAYFCGHFVGV